MRDLRDLKTAMTMTVLDAEDTKQHLYQMSNDLFILGQMVDEYFRSDINKGDPGDHTSPQYLHAQKIREYYNSLSEDIKDGDGYSFTVCNIIIHIEASITTTQAGMTDRIRFILTENTNDTSKNIDMFIMNDHEQSGGTQMPNILYADGQVIVAPGYSTNYNYDLFNDFSIGGINLGNAVTVIRDSIQMQDFICDLCDVIKGSKLYNYVTTKWLQLTHTSANVSNIVHDFASKVKDSPASIGSWLASVFTRAGNVDVEDGELAFTEYDYQVYSVFNTIIKGTITAIASVVGAIALTINRVAGIIVNAVTSLIQAIGSMLEKVTDPVIVWKGNEYSEDFLPIPICRASYSTEDSPAAFESTLFRGELGGCSIITWASATRCFSSDGGKTVNFETFLRMPFSPYTLIDYFTDLKRRFPNVFDSIASVGSGIYSLESTYSDLNAGSDSYDPYVIASMNNEAGQCLFIVFYLYFIMQAFCGYAGSANSSTLDQAKAAIANDSANINDLYNFLQKTCKAVVESAWSDDHIQDVFFGDSSDSYLYGYYNWEFLIKHLIPQLMNVLDIFPMEHYYEYAFASMRKKEFLKANEDFGIWPYARSFTATASPICFSAKDSGFIIPKHTGRGAIGWMIGTLAVVAAITVTSVIAYKGIKKKISRLQQDKALECADLKSFYEDVMSSSLTTDEDKTTAWNAYYRSVKRYNRMSFLWGGSTFSIVNGWDDGPKDMSSITSKFEDANTKLADIGILNQNTDTTEAAVQNVDGMSRIFLLIAGKPL